MSFFSFANSKSIDLKIFRKNQYKVFQFFIQFFLIKSSVFSIILNIYEKNGPNLYF